MYWIFYIHINRKIVKNSFSQNANLHATLIHWFSFGKLNEYNVGGLFFRSNGEEVSLISSKIEFWSCKEIDNDWVIGNKKNPKGYGRTFEVPAANWVTICFKSGSVSSKFVCQDDFKI